MQAMGIPPDRAAQARVTRYEHRVACPSARKHHDVIRVLAHPLTRSNRCATTGTANTASLEPRVGRHCRWLGIERDLHTEPRLVQRLVDGADREGSLFPRR